MIPLVNMPFVSLTHPTLAPGLIKALLRQAGIESRVFNFNLLFARRIGFGGYETMALFKGVETQVGEWLFAGEVWDEPPALSEDEFLDLCGDELDGLPHIADPRAWLRRIRREVVPPFLDECARSLAAAGGPRVAAFSCTFFQTLASLALGRRLKRRFPSLKLAYGGACFHGEMGDEIMRKAPWIDAVSTGEADDVLVSLFEALMADRAPEGLQGILYREPNGAVVRSAPHSPVPRAVIEANPVPDFDDFFSDAAAVGLDQNPQWRDRLLLPFESSRGCWWGQKQHCTFCGLNGEGMTYRSRSADRVFHEVTTQARRYPVKRFQSSDNILAMEYFRDLLPRFAEVLPAQGVELFYSVKANLNRARIAAMAQAGIRYVQPGIESLSTHLLDLMRKGVTALQNVFFLRCCREYGIEPYWNNLIRIPGETAGDYRQMEAWIPKLVHLRPPFGGSPEVECHRFSPYYFEAGRWNENPRPRRWYAGLYPPSRVDLHRVAYYFDADWKDTLGHDAYQEVVAATWEWSRIWGEDEALPRLMAHPAPEGSMWLEDTRQGFEARWDLDPLTSRIYREIDEPAGLARIVKQAGAETIEVERALDGLVNRGLALQEGGAWLALAVPEQTPEPPLNLRRRRLKRITNQRSQSPPLPAEVAGNGAGLFVITR